jgi:hypothetical protein
MDGSSPAGVPREIAGTSLDYPAPSVFPPMISARRPCPAGWLANTIYMRWDGKPESKWLFRV